MSGPYAPTDTLNATEPDPAPDERPEPEPVRWSVPSGTAEAAKAQHAKPTSTEESVVDALQRDVDPPAWPEGAPELRPYMRLPFERRADFLEQLDPIWEKYRSLPSKGSIGPKEAAAMYRTLAEIRDFLRPLATDEAAYDTWIEESSDNQFMGLFAAYFAGSQPGEAARSSS